MSSVIINVCCWHRRQNLQSLQLRMWELLEQNLYVPNQCFSSSACSSLVVILGVHTEEELMPHGYREDGSSSQWSWLTLPAQRVNVINYWVGKTSQTTETILRLLIRHVIAKTVVGPFGHHSVVFNEVSFCYVFTGFTLDSLLRQHKYNSVQQNLEV